MKIQVDSISLEFVSQVLKAGRELDDRALLYWSRKDKELLEFLKTQEQFEPITTEKIADYVIPALPETTRKLLWKKRLVPAVFADMMAENLTSKQPGTTPIKVNKFSLNVRLSHKELFTEIGSPEDLLPSCFTYSQICWLASRHGKIVSKKHNILNYDKTNYFPFVRSNGEVGFIAMGSRKGGFDMHKGWRAWFNTQDEDETSWLQEGSLFLAEDIRDLSQL